MENKHLEKLRGVFLDSDTVDDGSLDLSPITDMKGIEWCFHRVTNKSEVAERVSGFDIVICNKVEIDADCLRQSPRLQLIVVAATGTNNIDVSTANETGVTVCNVRGYGTPSVVQHVYTLILALTIQLPRYMEAVAQGSWERHPHFCLLDFPIRELDGCVMGIIGYGTLGQGVARAAAAFGIEVKICQRPGGPNEDGRIPLNKLLPSVDILTLHCPLTDATRGLIGKTEFGLMKDDAILINTARGGIVDESALVEALRNGRIGGAGIDVLSQEPPSAGNPLLQADVPNLIVTPHIAWASQASRQRVVNLVAENISAYLKGSPQNTVTV